MDSFGLMYYNARWYDPYLGRFAQADSIIPEPGNPLAFDRYSYVLNNPVIFIDQSGYNPECGPDGIWCSDDFELAYSITFSEERYWTDQYKAYVRIAIKAVAIKLATTLVLKNPAMAFTLVYGTWKENFTFVMGDCPNCADNNDNKAGAYTHGPRLVEFYHGDPFYSAYGNRTPKIVTSMNVHTVVHELGHAFAGQFKSDSPIHPYIMVENAEFSDGVSFLTNLGYAESPDLVSAQGYWRANMSTASNETIANMFVGWTYGAWANDGKIYGPERSNYMTTNMVETWLPVLVVP
jgi:RHS repeat-associated protein